MAKKIKRALPDGDFFMFADERTEPEFLKQASMSKDPDPAFTAWAAEQGQVYYRSLPQETPPKGMRPDYYVYPFDNPSFPMKPEWVHRSTACRTKIPRTLTDMQRVFDFSEGSHIYTIVSTQWRAAIEEVEPGVHEFFPHSLIFTDGVVSDRFILRTRQTVNFIMGTPFSFRFSEGAWRKDFRGPQIDIAADMDAIEGRHWLMDSWQHSQWVSRGLAEKLLPLLPDKTFFAPIKLGRR